MYGKLLVGYDDSPASRAALLEAAHWVKQHGGELALVHAAFFDTEEFGIAPEQLEKRIALGSYDELLQRTNSLSAHLIEIAKDVPAAVAKIEEKERAIINKAKQPGFNAATLTGKAAKAAAEH